VKVKSSTVSLNTALVTELKFESPPYAAAMECNPSASVERVKVAVPPFRLAVPSGVPLSEKTTEPVGMPAEDATVAVRVMTLCTRAGLDDAANTVVGATLFTVIERETCAAAE